MKNKREERPASSGSSGRNRSQDSKSSDSSKRPRNNAPGPNNRENPRPEFNKAAYDRKIEENRPFNKDDKRGRGGNFGSDNRKPNDTNRAPYKGNQGGDGRPQSYSDRAPRTENKGPYSPRPTGRPSAGEASKNEYKPKFGDEGVRSNRDAGNSGNYRSGSSAGGERKPWQSNERSESGDRKPFQRSENREGSERKPYQGTDRRESSERKPYQSNEGGDRKPFQRSDSERKPYQGTDRREGGDRKPFQSNDRRESSERKPWQSNDNRESSDRKPWQNKESSDRKPWQENDKKPEGSDRRKPIDSASRQVGSVKQPNFEESRMLKILPPKIKQKVEANFSKDKSIRLNRYIANAGLCSRREADEFISTGQITVNGKVITEMGYKVLVTDVIKYGRKILNREKLVYVLLNKPKDFLTTTDDPEGRRTVMDLVAKACEERIYPVGRLDRSTTGLLLLTNDGELADKLSHPSNEITKIYQVELDKPIEQEHFDQILAGVELEDGIVKADVLSIITPDNEVVGIEIHSGKNRIVRRIFESFGYDVKKLDRTLYAGLSKKDLPRGNWRFLTEKEVIRLKYMI